jgi:hypothetical protein
VDTYGARYYLGVASRYYRGPPHDLLRGYGNLAACGDPEGEDFDLSDPMYLVAVSAAGGLTDVLIGMKEEDIRAAGGINVSLGTTAGRSGVHCEAYHWSIQ